MALKVTFELEDKDLKYFRDLMKKAKVSAGKKDDDAVIAKAREVVASVDAKSVPLFVQTRLIKLNSLIDMVEDEEWKLDASERKNILSAIAYFAEPEDLIPDEVPVIGYIDDAIMIELVVTELRHELDAYDDFCRYRKENPKSVVAANRGEWLDGKRKALTTRMRRRRRAARARASGGTRSRLF